MNLNIFHLFHGVGTRGKGGIYPTSKSVERGEVQNYDFAPSSFLENTQKTLYFQHGRQKVLLKQKKKDHVCSQMKFVSLFVVTFGSLNPHFPSALKACPSLFVLSLGLPPPLASPLTKICNPPTFHLLRLHSPHVHVLSKSLSFTLPPTHTPLPL